ncbi:gliding motility-associated C-terminal domain-containing protein [Seonamhaeicola maritimus]|uniref:Gliding motility-associated C-terminal domain-containing protein n=1 Tax=Seonamhaeicola maritimus TaxID=2591822 RepID=A0A5C7GI34_9FLAO|nr:gliding motility-associated C-terminal domain-containing protein [Seonamhaeicola maritimus]TXG37470.1 gliding motility-associated C-terminal domain-containing protein [Seonamhaeicola maritimus]
MKIKPSCRYVLRKASYILALLWSSFVTYGQCPTITDPIPTICDASGYTFADLSSDYATDNGNGIVWYSASIGGSSYNPNELVDEGTYYADDDSGTCGSRVSIVVNFQVNPSNQNLDQIYCSNENATIQTYIDDVLQPSIPVGGSVLIYYDFNLTNLSNASDLLISGAANYYIVFLDNVGCESQIEVGQIGVFTSPQDPSPPINQQFCSTANPMVGNLDAGTTSTNINWYENLDAFGNPIPPALSPLTPLVSGNTYYVQVDDIFCVSNSVAVTVTIDTPVDPGTSSTLEYCDDSLPIGDFDLFDELGGTPDTTGTWSGPLTTSNGHSGTVNISTLTTAGNYTFTYTVPSTGFCPDGVSTVVITVYETLTSGIPSGVNPATYCESQLPTNFDLGTLLSGQDSNGLWTQGTLSTDPVVTSPIDLSGLTVGTHNFTYSQNLAPSPCLEESITVQVVVLTDPNAGNAVNQTFCENDLAANSPFDLFNALDASQDHNNGTWTDSSNTTISNSIDITGFTVSGSPYTFNYTIDNGACSDTESITIIVEPAPESGIPVATFPEYCEGEAPSTYDLFDLLEGEDQTGTWYIGTDNTGATISNSVDLSGYTSGAYNFTFDVNAIGSCDDVLATVSVTINPLPNTGTPTPATFCENDLEANSPLSLLGQLSGQDAGGTWTDDDATSALSGTDVDLTLLAVGSYNFTYSITDTNGCSNSSTVVVTVEDAPESGTPNAPLEFCTIELTAGQTVNLFDLLEDEDQTGTWNDDDTTGALSNNTLTVDGLADGTYNFTYDVAAIGSCDDVLVTVSVIINDPPPPTASPTQSFCDAGTVGDIVVTGTNIQWYDQATGGTPLTGTIDLTDGGTYYASQTDPSTSCESSVRTLVTASVNQTPIAGNPGSAITECNTNSSIDLFSTLDGTQDAGGVWQDNDGTGAVSGNTLDGTMLATGTYNFTYFIAAVTPCLDASVDVILTIEEALNPGTPAAISLCGDSGTTDLFPLLGGADIGGAWSPTLASGTGVFDPVIDTAGVYTYSLDNNCGTVSSTVTVSVTQVANAGTDDSIIVCVADGPTDLFDFLGGADVGGTWSPALASGTGVFDPLADVDGDYTYTVPPTAPCTMESSATITVAVSDSVPPTVIDPNPSYCLVDNPAVADLDSNLSATGTIIWYTDATLTVVLQPTETLIDGEDYFATQTGASGCPSSTSVQITVTVNDSPMPTLADANMEYCINDAPTIMDLTTNITEYDSNANNVVWYDAETGGSVINDVLELSNGTTYYAVLVDPITGCESSTRLPVTPDLTACGEVVLPDGFSPNDDGVNDTYDYDNLDVLYPNFEIEIYNRYGNIVYKGNANTPRFNGKSNQSRTMGSGDLPVGVYFYIFNFNDGVNKPKQGRLYLNR